MIGQQKKMLLQFFKSIKPISKYDDVVKYKSTLLSIIDGKIKDLITATVFMLSHILLSFEGHSKRINKREIFKKNDSIWTSTF